MSKLLIKNGTIVSVDPKIGDLAKGDILVDGGRIAEIAPTIAAEDIEVIDATDCIVTPGLVQAHIHSWQTALRGLGGDWAGTDYFTFFHQSIAPQYTPEDTYIGTLMGALMQIECGVTAMFDWCHNNTTPDHTDAAIEGLAESGIRGVFGHGSAKPKPKPGEKHFSETPHSRSEIQRLRTGRFASDDQLLTLAACILGPDYATLEVCRHDFRLAREFGLLSSAHVWGRSNRLNPRGYHVIAEEGLLGPDHNIVHGNYIEQDELKVIVDSGASATSTAAIELRNHHREPLSGRVMRLGGKPSISVDSEVSAAGSMFEVMRFALQAQRIFDNIETVRRIENNEYPAGAEYAKRNLKIIGTGGSPIEKISVTSRQVLEWGTMNNARAMRLDHKIGSLTPGKRADITLIRRDTLNMLCAHDPVQAVVFYAHGSDVDTVLIDGKIVKRRGTLLFPLLEKRRTALLASAARLLENSGQHVVA